MSESLARRLVAAVEPLVVGAVIWRPEKVIGKTEANQSFVVMTANKKGRLC